MNFLIIESEVRMLELNIEYAPLISCQKAESEDTTLS